MEAVIAEFRTATYPPFPSLSLFVRSCASSQAHAQGGYAQIIAQDLHAATRNLDGPTVVRFFLGLLWDLAMFIASRAQEFDAATFRGIVEVAWEALFADHSPIEDTLAIVIVCDLFCACDAASSAAQNTAQLAKSCFFDLCFGFPVENPKTSKNCGKLLSSLVSLVVSIGGEEEEGKGVRGLLDECARWLRDGCKPLPLFPHSPSPSPPTEWAYCCISELLQHHVVLSHSATFKQLNFTCPNLAHVILEKTLPHLLNPSQKSQINILSKLDIPQQAALAHVFTTWLTTTPSILIETPPSSTHPNTLVTASLVFSVSQPLTDAHGWYHTPATAAHAALMHVFWEFPAHPFLSPNVVLPTIQTLANTVASAPESSARDCAADRLAQVAQMLGSHENADIRKACAAALQSLPSTLLITTICTNLTS